MAREAVFLRDGGVISYKNPSSSVTVLAGEVVEMINCIGIAVEDIAPLAAGALAMSGVFVMPADNNLAIDLGDLVYWKTADNKINKTATSGHVFAGVAVEAKGSTGTTVKVLIGPKHTVTVTG